MEALRSLYARVRGMNPWRFDLLIAALFLLEAQLEVTLIDAPTDDKAAARLLFVVMMSGVAIRRRWPLLAVTLTLGGFIGIASLGRELNDQLGPSFLALFVVIFSVGHHAEGRRLWAGSLLTAVLAVTALTVDPYEDDFGDYIWAIGVLAGAPLLAGRALRNRAQLNRALREKGERLRREQAARVEAAALQERSRIAGELHDVVAHALGAMVIQASAARRLVDRDADRARDAFSAVEATGREALTEMRRLLGVLRKEDEEIALAPQPSLAHISTLIRRAAASGLPVQLDVAGEQRELPAGVDLIAYRVVQEALRGALEPGHAGRAQVNVRYGDEIVELEVLDDGGGHGRGLLAMRERVALYGGELQAGPRHDGRHAVHARLPVGSPA